jgi:hypothetical protein
VPHLKGLSTCTIYAHPLYNVKHLWIT